MGDGRKVHLHLLTWQCLESNDRVGRCTWFVLFDVLLDHRYTAFITQ